MPGASVRRATTPMEILMPNLTDRLRQAPPRIFATPRLPVGMGLRQHGLRQVLGKHQKAVLVTHPHMALPTRKLAQDLGVLTFMVDQVQGFNESDSGVLITSIHKVWRASVGAPCLIFTDIHPCKAVWLLRAMGQILPKEVYFIDYPFKESDVTFLRKALYPDTLGEDGLTDLERSFINGVKQDIDEQTARVVHEALLAC
jgi:hypothetical protein